jgi:hypothetical protein
MGDPAQSMNTLIRESDVLLLPEQEQILMSLLSQASRVIVFFFHMMRLSTFHILLQPSRLMVRPFFRFQDLTLGPILL